MKTSLKKIFLLIAVVVTAMVCFLFSASAATEGYYTYEVTNGEATIMSVDSSISGDIVIPDTLNGYPVTAIADYAFRTKDNIKTIRISDMVKSIGDSAFYWCSNLKSVIISESVEIIGTGAFEACESLRNIIVDENNKHYSEDNGVLFNKDKSILIQYPIGCFDKSYIIPNGVKTVGEGAFSSCKLLESIVISDTVINIGAEAFSACGNLQNLTIGNSVTNIGDCGFNLCHRLESIKIPASVTSIGEYAFASCAGLRNISVEDKNKVYSSIDGVLFNKDKSLLIQVPSYYLEKAYMIPDSVKVIGPGAFGYNGNLKCVTIGNNVKTISDGAFYGCLDLKSVTIGKGVEKIGVDAYKNSFIKDVYYSGTEEAWKRIDIDTGNEELILANVQYGKMLIHAYKTTVTPPTCQKNGYTTYSCSCGSSYTDNYVNKTTNHKYTSKITKAATCTETGTKTFNCSCGASYTEKISKTSHTNTTSTTKATLKKNGKTVTKCSVCGCVSKTTAINKIKSVKLSVTEYTYNGKTKTPSVTVKDSKGKALKKGTDYTVTYPKKRKSIGKYTVTVTFKGKYSGTKKLTFEIVPAKTTLSKVTAGSKQATVTWKTVSGATGYEVVYSTSKKFTKKTTKTATIKKAKTKKTTIKKLKKGKKYYFKVRAYKTVDGKKIYGAWSSVKNVKIK